MSEEELIKSLNEDVPDETIIRIQLKQIKRLEEETYGLEKILDEQESVIDDLYANIKRLELNSINIQLVIQNMTRDERKILQKDPLYCELEHVSKLLKLQVKEKEKIKKQLINDICVLCHKLDKIDGAE